VGFVDIFDEPKVKVDPLRIEIDPNSRTPGADYLEAVVRNSNKPDHERARAARELLPFEKPKLSAMALVHRDGDYAERLERAIERSDRARVINGNAAKVIEHQPQPSIRRI
jgi:hypothetical protein